MNETNGSKSWNSNKDISHFHNLIATTCLFPLNSTMTNQHIEGTPWNPQEKMS